MSHVLVLSQHFPNLDRRIVHQMNALVDSGREVTLVSLPAEIPYETIDRRVHVIAPAPPPPDSDSPVSMLVRIGRCLPMPLRKVARLGYAQLQRVRDRLRADPHRIRFFLEHTPARDYAFIHCHDLNTLPVGVALKRQCAAGAKIIYDSHELFPHQVTDRRFVRYWTRVERSMIDQADAIITVNESIARILADTYGVETPTVIYNSHDAASNHDPIDRDEFFRLFDCPDDGFNVLFQGSLGDAQNLNNLIQAFGQLDRSFRLLLIGTGPAEPTLRETCNQQGLTNVHFGGWVDQERLMHYTPHADLGIVPYQDQSGLLNVTYCTPNKLFEFIEAGLPICASDLPELRNIVVGHGIGNVYAMSTPSDIAAAVTDCRRRVEAGEFQQADRTRAREHFAWRHQADKLLEIYDGLETSSA